MMDHLTFSNGRVSISGDLTLWSIAMSCNSTLINNFRLNDPDGILESSDALHLMLQHIFDADTRGFFTEECYEILAGLDGLTKARMLVQAMAGMVLIFRRLSGAGTQITSRTFNRELQLFAEAEARTSVMGVIETTPVFGRCYMKSQIVDVVMDAIEGKDGSVQLSEYDEGGMLSWATADLPSRNMGLPWGFCIMALN
jgi:hypothetical protein